jgi:protein-tyrosine phosphatase
VKVLFVCTGNICRSPTGEAVLRKLARDAGVAVEVDSAGISAYHEGEGADRRSSQAAALRGYDLSGHRSRALRPGDFQEYDLLLAMDRSHYEFMREEAPASERSKVRFFLPEYAPEAGVRDVPDPYYGGANGFETVLDLLETGCRRLLEELSAKR